MASLSLYVPDQEPYAISLDGYEQVTVGRAPENVIVLDHGSLSGSHAVIHNVNGVFQVQDLGSTNGTFVNSTPITDPVVLSNGDVIHFGGVETVFTNEVAASATSGASAASAAPAGHGFESDHLTQISTVSGRPAGFQNLSPIEKVKPKNTIGLIATIVGVIAILASLTLVVLTFMMKGA